VNSDALVRAVITQIISKHWPEKVDLDAGTDNSGNQYFGEAWRYPGWGCDTLDHMVDDLVSVMASMVVDNSKQSDNVLEG
jgi:hypothetical protein